MCLNLLQNKGEWLPAANQPLIEAETAVAWGFKEVPNLLSSKPRRLFKPRSSASPKTRRSGVFRNKWSPDSSRKNVRPECGQRMRRASMRPLPSYPGDLLRASASRVQTRHPSRPGPVGGQGAGPGRGEERTPYFRLRPLPETPFPGFPWLPGSGVCAVPGAWLRDIAPPPRPGYKMESVLWWGVFFGLCLAESLSGDSNSKLERNLVFLPLPFVTLPFSKY